MNILGISALYHDSAACLVQNGAIVAAAQEERFTRKKYDESLPVHAIEYCLRAGKVQPGKIDWAVFYEKPLTKFLRILRTHFAVAPRSWASFVRAMPGWVHDKLWISYRIDGCCRKLGYGPPRHMGYTEHHQAHAASAFLPSPFEEATILTMDGVGEWTTTAIGFGRGRSIQIIRHISFPHSLGLLYSAFSHYCGFRVNSGEYKLMGLAPYGSQIYSSVIRERLIRLNRDGSFHLDLRYFDYIGGLTMTNRHFAGLFGGPPRKPESAITQREADLAASIQAVLEEAVINLARAGISQSGSRNLCLAGGVALNCVANGRLLREGVCDQIWIQPASGDAGGALGAALYTWHQQLKQPRKADGKSDQMHGALLGPEYSEQEIKGWLDRAGYQYRKLTSDNWADEIARLIAAEKVIGLFQGRLEFGPRALGSRSIIADPRSPRMQSLMNLKIKHRESFRPFAPAVILEKVSDYFQLDRSSPYMLLVAGVKPDLRLGACDESDKFDLTEKVNKIRSCIPAVTHVDYSARVQTVSEMESPRFYGLLKAFERLTGCGVLINTSFNVRGEPPVCTPQDAYRCFMRTDMDYLVIESFILDKKTQPSAPLDEKWMQETELD